MENVVDVNNYSENFNLGDDVLCRLRKAKCKGDSRCVKEFVLAHIARVSEALHSAEYSSVVKLSH